MPMDMIKRCRLGMNFKERFLGLEIKKDGEMYFIIKKKMYR